jgi:hypothetical protein
MQIEQITKPFKALEEPKLKKIIPGTDLSDVDSVDEIGAPKAKWLINVERELK